MFSFLIADDHKITRLGVISIIKSLYENYVLEEAENGQQIFDQLKVQPFDILITDLGMPQTDTFRLIDTALALQPKLRILILSMNKEELYASNYLQKGALGYIEKNSNSDEMERAIQTVLAGNIYMSPMLTKSYVTGKISKAGNPFDALTQRELDVCIMLCAGKTITDIAAVLHLGVSTVGTHKVRVLKKVGVANLVELIKMYEQYPLSS